MLTPTRIQIAAGVAYTLIVSIITWGIAAHWYSPKPVAITAHPMVLAKNGTEAVAARVTVPEAPKQEIIPKTAKPREVFHVTLEGGKPVPKTSSVSAARCAAEVACPSISVDGTLVTQKDGQPDLYLSTGGNLIKEAHLSVLDGAAAPPEHRHALGVIATSKGRWGAVYERQSGPVRLGVEVLQPPPGDKAPEFAVSAMWVY